MNNAIHPAFIKRSLVAYGVAAALALSVVHVTARADTPTARSDSAGAAIDDSAITTKIKAKFLADDRVKSSHIKVVTTNGVVTLTGSALTSESKAAAEEVAMQVDGVKSVDNELGPHATSGSTHKAMATAEREGSDGWITTKVKSEILSDSVSHGFDVHVDTAHGVVTLTGRLPNRDAVAHVKDLAERVKGVKSVDTSDLMASAG
jgi:hyperosmotically inducible periplasmic protein